MSVMALASRRQRRPVERGRCVSVSLGSAVAVLRRDPGAVIGSHVERFMAEGEAYTDLGVEVLGGRRVARDVRVGFGPVLEDDDVVAVPVWWEATEHPELFPTFDGGLELRPAADGTELRLVGSYQPPLGSVGGFADTLVGHRIVTASLERLLSAAAERLVAMATTEAVLD
jgi:hypothetical protein